MAVLTGGLGEPRFGCEPSQHREFDVAPWEPLPCRAQPYYAEPDRTQPDRALPSLGMPRRGEPSIYFLAASSPMTRSHVLVSIPAFCAAASISFRSAAVRQTLRIDVRRWFSGLAGRGDILTFPETGVIFRRRPLSLWLMALLWP